MSLHVRSGASSTACTVRQLSPDERSHRPIVCARLKQFGFKGAVLRPGTGPFRCSTEEARSSHGASGARQIVRTRVSDHETSDLVYWSHGCARLFENSCPTKVHGVDLPGSRSGVNPIDISPEAFRDRVLDRRRRSVSDGLSVLN
jgi:hypothetical protein